MRKTSEKAIFLIGLGFLYGFMLLQYVTRDNAALADEADGYTHLYEVMDKYHQTFDVYTDQDAGGNHYFPSGWMGDLGAIQFDGRWKDNPYSGDSCIKITFLARGDNWAGIYWQNPENNWGTVPNGGYNLTGATKLTFWGRSEKGKVYIEFFVGGITGPYPDSLPRTPTFQIFELSETWKKYNIDLRGKNLSHVIGGFGWATNTIENPNSATFYLDDIQYDLQRPNELRLLCSYETIPSENDFDKVMKNVAFTYDNAVAMLALMARGTAEDWQRARLLADAFVYAQQNDRYYTDGRLRNAYMCGDLIDHAVVETFGKAKLPGWWDEQAQKWFEDAFQVGSHTGNMAWVMLALLTYYEAKGGEEYLNAALSLGEWIVKETKDPESPFGYTAGYERWEPNPTKLTYKSTEHNIDVYTAFLKACNITGDNVWKERAIHALLFLHTMWDDSEGHFWIGTLDDGKTPWTHPDAQPMDVNSWGLMALDNAQKHGRGITWVENNTAVETLGFSGFDFNPDKDGIWWEGTGQMVIVYQILGDEQKAELYLNQLRDVQMNGENSNGKGIIAATPDGITTGLYIGDNPWLYYSRLHVAATSWYLFAERRFNPLETSCPVSFSLVTTADTDYNWIVLCDETIKTAEELAQAIPNCLTVSYFDPQTQGFVTHPIGTPINNFSVQVGYPYQVTVSAPGTWEVEGVIPTAVTFNLVTTPDTDYNWIAIPFELSHLQTAEELGQAIPNCGQVSRYDAQKQGFITHPVGTPINNFSVQYGEVYQITISKNIQWPQWP